MADNKLLYSNKLTNLRALAILIVVLGHSIILYDPNWTLFMPPKEYKPFMILKQVVNLIQMPLFYSISGYLYFWTVNKKDFKTITKNKIYRVLIPFILVLILYSNPLKYYLEVPGYESYSRLLKNNLIFMDLGHLWFLPVLFFLFVLNYLPFRWKSPKYSLIFVFFLILLSYFSYYLPNYYLISSTAYYWLFFYFGGIMNKFNLLERYEGRYKITLSICLLMIIIIGILLPYKFSIPTSLLAIPLTYLIIPNRTSASIAFLASLSFGIYLFHSPLIYITYTQFSGSSPWLVLSLNFIVFGGVAILITWLLKHSHLKFIIGE